MFLLFYTKGWVQMRDLQQLLDELKDMSFLIQAKCVSLVVQLPKL